MNTPGGLKAATMLGCVQVSPWTRYGVEEQKMSFPPKEVQCKCGNQLVVDGFRTWCEKCANPVYYHAKDQNKHKWNNYYISGLILAAIAFLGFVFIELIAIPLTR